MGFTEKNIYELLPAYYRSKDFGQGSPLQALINIIAGKGIAIENNIAQLYDNWFIETCEEWVVPYIADLLGVQNFNAISGSSAVSQRAFVANTLSYRRRKGIAPVLEQLSLDIAGWRAHVVEFFQSLATTQYMNHIRLDHPVTPDLRLMDQLDLVNSAFDLIAHSIDVRHVSNNRGKYNIANTGLFIWRIQSYKVTLAEATMVPCLNSPPSFYFTFSALGYDLQLFNNPKTEVTITHISEEINLPVPLRRRLLFDESDARRKAIVDGIPVTYNFFDDNLEVEGDMQSNKKHPVFEIFFGEPEKLVPPEEILICDLGTCCSPPESVIYQQLQLQADKKTYKYVPVVKPITVAVDPVRGRFVFTDPSIEKARVSYSYGFSGDIGSGTYNRQDFIPRNFQSGANGFSGDENSIWQVGVSKKVKPSGAEKIYTTITEAINEWSSVKKSSGIISIMDNESYDEDLTILIEEKRQLLIIAADWPLITPDDDPLNNQIRVEGIISADSLQPVINGTIKINSVTGSTAGFETKTGGQITLNGLLIQGKLTVIEGNLAALNISNCTIVPESGGIEIGMDTSDISSNQWLQITLQKSICGSINLFNTESDLLMIEDSIIDNQNDWAILSNNTTLQISRTTVLGKLSAKTITAENCIFNDFVTVERKQTGCIRFSYVTMQSQTPRRFYCQPELEINNEIASGSKSANLSSSDEDIIRNKVSESLLPAFTSIDYGNYAYGQLSRNCPEQITAGADNGAEMGVFNYLKQPQRKANLLSALDEYLRLGLEAGLFYVT